MRSIELTLLTEQETFSTITAFVSKASKEMAMKSRMTSHRMNLHAVLLGAAALISTQAFGQGTDQQREACTPDVFRLCKSYIPDADRITTCLRDNSAQLSRACYAVFYPAQTTDLRRPPVNGPPVIERPVIEQRIPAPPPPGDDED